MNKFSQRNIKIICNGSRNYNVYYVDGHTEYFVGHYPTNDKLLIIMEVRQWYDQMKMKLEGGAEYGTICKAQTDHDAC